MMMPHDDAVDMHDVQGVHDERAMFLPAQGLDAEHTEQPLGIYATALEAATVYARYVRTRATSGPGDSPGDGRGVAVCCGVLDGVA